MKNESLSFEFEIQVGQPIELINFEVPIDTMKRSGVYILRQGVCNIESWDCFDQQTIYIGKAIKETIFSRCRKHLWTIRKCKSTNGNARTRPGKNFISYRESINCSPSGIYVVPVFIIPSKSYFISFYEEFLLKNFHIKNNRAPIANTSI